MPAPVETSGFRYGIEEEFFLVHARTGRLASRMPAGLVREARERLGGAIGPELMQSQVEISSPILSDTEEARQVMSGLRHGLAQVTEQHGLRLLSAGTHPLGAWRGQTETSRHRYRRLVDDFQIIARRNLVCGLHVHAEVPPGVDRVQLMNRIMPWLPLFLALSTSSPFWNRERTGLLSYRQAIYDEWPRTGTPDFFDDQAQYDHFADLLAKNNAIKDAGSLWWAIRPALNYPTLELRIADGCTRLRDTLAIASLFRCLVRSLVRRPDVVPSRSAITRRVIDENRWRAKRFGIGAKFIDEGGGPATTVPEALRQLREACAEDAETLGCHEELANLDRILVDGTSADRQLALYHQRREEGDSHARALGHVVDWLLATTAEAP
jgi:glutamate---cysteine ligase / carboxylate-amine ligase